LLFQHWSEWLYFEDDSLIFFVNPSDICEINKTDIFEFKMKIVFDAFCKFTEMVKSEKGICEWMSALNKQGGDAVTMLLTWPLYFGHYQEGFSMEKK